MVFILAENARDAMPKGGKLAVSLENVSPDMDYREKYGLPDDGTPNEYVALTVADTGRGIPAEMLDHIFEPFFTIKPDGTGLGLSIVHSIVRQCRGYVSARSEEKKGTAFTIHFPVFPGEDRGEEEMPFHPGEAVPFTNATVLVVEDESGILYWVTDVLEGLGYRVLSSFNAEEAVSNLAQLSEPLDLLITDLVLPGISGTDLAAMLKARYPDMKVIFMSGHPDARSERADLPRKSPFLAKPFTPLLLLMKVKEVLGTHAEAPRTDRQNS
jgi:two-component system, cell cycle sensor histidine kinase and response regulator CckA